MVVIGLVVTLLGFGIAVASGISADSTVRLVIVCAGIAVSVFGILGLINPAYLN